MLLADFKLVIFNIISCYVKSNRRQEARQADLRQDRFDGERANEREPHLS